MYDLSGLGARIRQLRIQRGFTQESFAKELGISAQAVSKWETGVGCPDIGTLPLIANLLETTIDSLFSEAEPAVEPEPVTPAEPVPGEVLPVYKEEPEAARREGVRVVFASANLECLADMEPDSIDGLIVHFADGSSADLKTRTIVNYGGGTIKIQEAASRREARGWDSIANLGEDITKQVEDVLRSSGIHDLENLGDLISERVNRAIRWDRADASPNANSNNPGELTWNGVDIDSLDVSVSGNVDVNVHSGTPGKWSVVAHGQREFLNSLRCIEDGNILKIETLPYKSARNILFNGKNTIEICTGFSQGADLDIKVKGSGDFSCEPSFQSSRVSVGGSGNIDLTDAGILTCGVSGSGDITFISAKNANITVSGSGDIDAGRIDGVSEVKISGSGDASLGTVTGQLTCRVSGSGDIDIGEIDLEELFISISGSGDVSAAAGKVGRLEFHLHGSSDFEGKNITVGELIAELNGPSDATIGRLLGKSVERVSRTASLRILSRG